MEGTAFSPSSPAGLLAAADQLVAPVDEILWAAKSPDEIVETVAACEKLRSHLAAIEAAALAEVEDRRIAKNHLAWSSTGDWFTHLAGTYRGPGRSAVRHAKVLVGDRSLTRDALRDGLVSPEQAGVICDAIEELPTNPHVRELAEKQLLDEAGRLHATDLAKAARHLIHVIDPRRHRTQGREGPGAAGPRRPPRPVPRLHRRRCRRRPGPGPRHDGGRREDQGGTSAADEACSRRGGRGLRRGCRGRA